MLERMDASSAERMEGLEKLEGFVARATESYRDENIPVGPDGRIDMRAYTALYPDVQKDLARNHDWETDWFGDVSDKTVRAERRLREGEQLEILAHAIFLKNLGEEFVVVRSSPHDDRVNKVDTLILDRKTGALLCAFDEIGNTTVGNIDYDKKLSGVRDINLKGGAKLKYGIGTKAKGGATAIVPVAAEHLPLFYIALPADRVKKGMEEFVPDAKRQSEFEEKLFTYFVATITTQIQGLELYSNRLDPKLKENLTTFKVIMKKLAGHVLPARA